MQYIDTADMENTQEGNQPFQNLLDKAAQFLDSQDLSPYVSGFWELYDPHPEK